MNTQLFLFPNLSHKATQTLAKVEEEEDIDYPSSDGKPMSENTLHFDILNYLKNSLESLTEHNPNIFVAGDLMIYYAKGNIRKRIAPDVMVAFDNHKGDRGSYIIHKENHTPPTATFEIISPSNIKNKPDLWKRWLKYAEMKVKEYFVIHAIPARGFRIESFKEVNGVLVSSLDFGRHTSERLGVEVFFENDTFVVQTLSGERLNPYVKEVNLRKIAEEAKKQAEEREQKAKEAKKQAEEREQKAKEEERRANEENQILKDNMEKQLRELEELRKLVTLELGEKDE